jgi:hypothetical protein
MAYGASAYMVRRMATHPTREGCHMKLMSEAQAKRVPAIAMMLMEKVRADRERRTGT